MPIANPQRARELVASLNPVARRQLDDVGPDVGMNILNELCSLPFVENPSAYIMNACAMRACGAGGGGGFGFGGMGGCGCFGGMGGMAGMGGMGGFGPCFGGGCGGCDWGAMMDGWGCDGGGKGGMCDGKGWGCDSGGFGGDGFGGKSGKDGKGKGKGKGKDLVLGREMKSREQMIAESKMSEDECNTMIQAAGIEGVDSSAVQLLRQLDEVDVINLLEQLKSKGYCSNPSAWLTKAVIMEKRRKAKMELEFSGGGKGGGCGGWAGDDGGNFGGSGGPWGCDGFGKDGGFGKGKGKDGKSGKDLVLGRPPKTREEMVAESIMSEDEVHAIVSVMGVTGLEPPAIELLRQIEEETACTILQQLNTSSTRNPTGYVIKAVVNEKRRKAARDFEAGGGGGGCGFEQKRQRMW